MAGLTLSLSITKSVTSVSAAANTLTIAEPPNLAVGDPFTLSTTGTYPGGLSSSLYVGTGSSGNTIYPADSGGSLIDITTVGSGTLTISHSYSVEIDWFQPNGYNRIPAAFTGSERSAYGNVSIRKPLYEGYLWQVAGFVTSAELQTLQALIRAADRNWDASTQNGSWILEDTVEPVVDIGSRTRELATGATETIGSGKRIYYAKFNVQISDFEFERIRDGIAEADRLYVVRFNLTELEKRT